MNNRIKFLLSLSLAPVAAFLLGSVGHFQAAQQIDLQTKARSYAADLHTIPVERLNVINSAWLGHALYRAKLLDETTGEIHIVSLHPSGELATDQEVADLLRSELEKGLLVKSRRT